MDVGEKIKLTREKRGLQQLELANKINISQSKMNKIETGYQKKIEPEILRDIAKALNVSTDYLIGHTDIPDPYEVLALHRSDDPMDDLPEEARKSIEEFKDYILRKHGLKKD